MELRHLRYFLVLAEELHFGRTAKRLFISQPPLSRQIKELEQQLGATLFLRDNKRVELTQAGRFFYKEAQRLMQSLEAAQQRTQQIHQSYGGEIKIGYISSADKSKLGKLIQRLQHCYPLLQTKLFELSTQKQVQALENAKIDIGIIRAPNLSARLQTSKLYEDGFCLVYGKHHQIPKDFSLLSEYPFISYHADSVPVYHNQILACCAKLGFSPNLRHQCNTISSILELVHLGAGISVVPRSVQSQYQHLDIAFYDLQDLGIKTEILLAHQREPEHPVFPKLKELMLSLLSG